MLTLSAEKYLSLGSTIADVKMLLRMIAESPTLRDGTLIERELSSLDDELANIANLAIGLGLPVTKRLLDDFPRRPQITDAEFDIIVRAMNAELENKHLAYIPADRFFYYDHPDNRGILKVETASRFPSAYRELVWGGNAYALGLPTACVFHSMRAAEIGVRAFGLALGVTFPDKPIELAEWHSILEQADSKIVAMKALPKGKHKDDELGFYSQAGVQLRYFKDAYRIRVAHARESYDDDSARKILDHTRDFFETIAKRLKEPT